MDEKTKRAKFEVQEKEMQVHETMQKIINDYFEHYEVGDDFHVVDFMWALLRRMALNYSPIGCPDKYIRKHKKNAAHLEQNIQTIWW